MSKQSRRGFFGSLGIGAAVAAVIGRAPKEPEPERLPVFIRADGMLVTGDGKELGFAIVTKERNPDQYELAEVTTTVESPGVCLIRHKYPPRPASLTFMPDERAITGKDEEQG